MMDIPKTTQNCFGAAKLSSTLTFLHSEDNIDKYQRSWLILMYLLLLLCNVLLDIISKVCPFVIYLCSVSYIATQTLCSKLTS